MKKKGSENKIDREVQGGGRSEERRRILGEDSLNDNWVE